LCDAKTQLTIPGAQLPLHFLGIHLATPPNCKRPRLFNW
jgi:hypothetical protein